MEGEELKERDSLAARDVVYERKENYGWDVDC